MLVAVAAVKTRRIDLHVPNESRALPVKIRAEDRTIPRDGSGEPRHGLGGIARHRELRERFAL